jgi:hypothetical protein
MERVSCYPLKQQEGTVLLRFPKYMMRGGENNDYFSN